MGPGSHPDQVWWQREQAPRAGDTSPYYGRGRARLSLLVGLGHELQQHLVVIQRVPNPNMSYAPVRVPYLWMSSTPRSAPAGLGRDRS